ncbi:putative membrane protein [Bacillus mycoides]|nr:putative membrane protein [Bacillus mycoides]
MFFNLHKFNAEYTFVYGGLYAILQLNKGIFIIDKKMRGNKV